MFGWLTKRLRRRSPSIPRLPSAERDWASGDLAICIADGTWRDHPSLEQTSGPAFGQMLRVHAVAPLYGTIWLSFAGAEDRYAPAGYFRKLRKCTSDFGDQIRQRAPAPSRKRELVP